MPTLQIKDADTPLTQPGADLPLANPTQNNVRINTTTAGDQHGASMVYLPDGSAVVIWTSTIQDPGGNPGVYGQRLDVAGNPVGGEFRVNTTTTGEQRSASVTTLTDGGFIVTWQGQGPGDASGVFMQRYNATGAAVGVETLVNTTIAGGQFASHVEGLAGGGFVVAWSTVQVVSGSVVFNITAQRFDAAGTRVGGEIAVNSQPSPLVALPQIQSLADGGFMVLWTGVAGGDASAVAAQRYNASGVAQGANIRLNTTTTGDQELGGVTALVDGRFVAVWSSEGASGIPQVFGRFLDATGTPSGGEFRITAATNAYETFPVVTGLANGEFIVMWDNGGEGGNGLFARTFNANGTPASPGGPVVGMEGSPSEVFLVAREADLNLLWNGPDADSSGVFLRRFFDLGAYHRAANDVAFGGERTVLTGSVLTNDTEGDLEDELLSVVAVNGVAGNVGTPIILPSGARLTLNADGSYTYDPNGAYNGLTVAGLGASNTSGTDSFTYTLPNGAVGTVTVTLFGSYQPGDDFTGTAGNDVLGRFFGGAAGTGANRMSGGAGNDFYFVDDLGDTIIDGVGQGTNDRVFVRLSGYVLTPGAEIEIISVDDSAGTAVVDITGNAFGQRIQGNEGANTLNGLGGDDTLIGMGGNDVLNGGDGADYLNGGAGDDMLNGGAGIDEMFGGLGNDIYIVDNAADRVIETALQGVDVVRTSVSYALTGGSEIERLETTDASGTAAINLSGNGFAQTLVGNAGNNQLNGGGGDVLAGLEGADVLDGGAGRDSLNGGDGADILIGGAGDDTLNGGNGLDTARFSGNRADYVVRDLGGGAWLVTDTVGGRDGQDYMINVERLQFTNQLVSLTPAAQALTAKEIGPQTLPGADIGHVVHAPGFDGLDPFIDHVHADWAW